MFDFCIHAILTLLHNSFIYLVLATDRLLKTSHLIITKKYGLEIGRGHAFNDFIGCPAHVHVYERNS